MARRLRQWLKTSKAEHPKPKAISPQAIAGGNPTYIAYAQATRPRTELKYSIMDVTRPSLPLD